MSLAVPTIRTQHTIPPSTRIVLRSLVMSIYGQFDYLDVLSRASLLAPRGEEELGDASVGQQSEEEDDYLLVLDDAAATTVAESSDSTTLPSEIRVSSDDDESRSGTGAEGMTILASLPSHEAAAWQLQQQQLQALSMQVYGAPRNTRNAHSTISLSTTETHFTDVVHDDDTPSSVSSLSLGTSMASWPSSSGFSQEIAFEQNSEAESLASGSSQSNVSNDESTLVKDVQEINPPPASFLSKFNMMSNNKKKKNGPWYSHLQTEQDWEAFRAECLTLMQAMGEDAPKNTDEILAQLIEQEEEMLYTKKKCAASGTLFGVPYETIALMAGAALVPLVGFALVSSRNCRREKAN